MTLFWHHHFATAYSKIAGIVGNADATRMMAAKPSAGSDAACAARSSCFRDYALGNFRELLVEVAKDPAMLYWLDGRLERARAAAGELRPRADGAVHVRRRALHRAGRLRGGARVHRLESARHGDARNADARTTQFIYNAAQHDTNAKDFTFPIYAERQQAHRAAQRPRRGMQDGLDLINALAIHPETAQRLARRLWTWFVSEIEAPDPAFVDKISQVYLDERHRDEAGDSRACCCRRSSSTPTALYQRYAWPVEFVVRSLKEVGPRRLLGRQRAARR